MVLPHPEILLIEDSEHDAELTFRALRAKMPAVQHHHVTDGEEALEYLQRRGRYANQTYHLPLLVLLDMDLPKIKGTHVLAMLKTDPLTQTIPVVVLTISTSVAQMKEAYRLGANSYIIKAMNFVKYSLTIAEVAHYWLLINDQPNHVKTDR